MSDRYAVIGNPVAHSKSPLIHAEFARATGQDMSERARLAQAVNTLRFEDSFGDNTDGVGLIRDIVDNLGVSLNGRTARFPGASACGYDALKRERFDIVINATSAGLAAESPPVPGKLLAQGVLAYEMVYGRDTPFLAAARRAGAAACDGLGMLVEQAAESFFIWRGVRPATRPVLAKLRGS